jgi:hypothetical protein
MGTGFKLHIRNKIYFVSIGSITRDRMRPKHTEKPFRLSFWKFGMLFRCLLSHTDDWPLTRLLIDWVLAFASLLSSIFCDTSVGMTDRYMPRPIGNVFKARGC